MDEFDYADTKGGLKCKRREDNTLHCCQELEWWSTDQCHRELVGGDQEHPEYNSWVQASDRWDFWWAAYLKGDVDDALQDCRRHRLVMPGWRWVDSSTPVARLVHLFSLRRRNRENYTGSRRIYLSSSLDSVVSFEISVSICRPQS
jgi:hypothetical protein